MLTQVAVIGVSSINVIGYILNKSSIDNYVSASTTAATLNNYIQAYSYNPIGNITNKSDQGAYLYQGNQGTSYCNPHFADSINGQSYACDNNGNLASANGWTYAWDYNDRMISASNGISTTTYAYDHEGNRVKKIVDGIETLYINKYYDIENGIAKNHIFAKNEAIAEISSSTTHYIHNDHLSGSNIITNENGAIVQLLDYYPFGDLRLNEQESGFDEKKKAFGHEYDSDSGLYYMQARYQSPSVGRFMSIDPVAQYYPTTFLADPQQLNTYSYSRNNPLRFIDPLGLFNKDTGEIEKGDNLTAITNTLNDTYGTSLTINNVASAKRFPFPI